MVHPYELARSSTSTACATVYLLRYQLWISAMIRTTAVTLVIHSLAIPMPGLGVAVPVFAPVVSTAIVAFILSRQYAPPLAHVCGSLGTLIGADLLNLNNINGL